MDKAAWGSAPRPRSRAARRRPLEPAPLSAAATSSKKRALPPGAGAGDGAFPQLSLGARRPVAALAKAKAPSAEPEGAWHPRERLLAAGLRRSVVQAQLLPDSNQDADSDASTSRPLDSAVRVTPSALVPSRPLTSALAQRHRLPERAPQTARELAQQPAERPREPLSARDRFYVEQRAATAPSTSTSRAVSVRRRQAQLRAATERPQLEPREHEARSNNNQTPDAELPRRLMLLEKRNTFTTFTESLARHLSRANQVGFAGLDRDSFLYLRRVDSNPYNLALATHAEIDPNDYYTVSRLGITHFSHNSSEFVPLDKFEQEHYQYSAIIMVRWHAILQ